MDPVDPDSGRALCARPFRNVVPEGLFEKRTSYLSGSRGSG